MYNTYTYNTCNIYIYIHIIYIYIYLYIYIYIYISVNTHIDFKTLLNVPLSFKLLLWMIYEVFSGGKIFWY